MLSNREDAEEALQDAFTRAYRSLSGAKIRAVRGLAIPHSGQSVPNDRARRGRRARTFVVDESALLEARWNTPRSAGVA